MARRRHNTSQAPAGEPNSQAEPAAASALTTSVREDGTAVLISVRARPRAHINSLQPEREGAWPVSVRAAASEGVANAAVLAVLARAVGRPPSTCSLWRGARSRDKVVRVEAMSASEARARLEKFVGVA